MTININRPSSIIALHMFAFLCCIPHCITNMNITSYCYSSRIKLGGSCQLVGRVSPVVGWTNPLPNLGEAASHSAIIRIPSHISILDGFIRAIPTYGPCSHGCIMFHHVISIDYDPTRPLSWFPHVLGRRTHADWWFGTFSIFHNIWHVILPIDFHIFQDGYCTC